MKIRLWMVAAILIAATFMWRVVYPWIITREFSRETPVAWNKTLLSMAMREIYQTLGQPDEDVSTKEYQSWIRKHWWGWQQLKVLVPHCCTAASRPSEVYYVVHVNGFYDPIIIRRIE